jgi:hypothetical protein
MLAAAAIYPDTRAGVSVLRRLVAMLFLPLLASCGAIINGSRQHVTITSEPPRAKVTVDNDTPVTTPATVNLRRKSSHRVRIELDGYQPYDMQINRRVSAWWVGSFVLTGGLGVVVDLLSGALYALQPKTCMRR